MGHLSTEGGICGSRHSWNLTYRVGSEGFVQKTRNWFVSSRTVFVGGWFAGYTFLNAFHSLPNELGLAVAQVFMLGLRELVPGG